MAGALLEGRIIAEGIKGSVREQVGRLTAQHGASPRLVAVQIGQNVASTVYVKAQQKTAEALGIAYDVRMLPGSADQDTALRLIGELNADSTVTGIILQLPVPKGIDPKALVAHIDPKKDAEGMHPHHLGRILLGEMRIGPCTAMAVMELLAATKLDLYGKEAVVVGHSEIVGKPLSLLLLSQFATTTVCHIATGERGALPDHVKRAEILIVAVGKAGIVKGSWIRPGAVVIDVGINRDGDKIVGDVEFDSARERAAFITPVPGGVGPVTTTILMRNVVELYKDRFHP